jgi:uncharacterized protein YdgA (DUF945 family)
MNRKVLFGILALPVLALLFLGMCWLDGAVVRSRMARADDDMNTTLPFFTVAQRQVKSGLFSSTVEVTYEFNSKILNGIAAASAGAKKTALIANAPTAAAPPHLTLRHHIAHGPVPGFAALGLARIDTEIVIPDEARTKLRDSVGTDQPLKIVTLLGYAGGGTTTVESPAFTYNATGEAGRVEWRGIQGRVNFSRGMNSSDGEITFLGMSASGSKQEIAAMGPIRLAFDLKRVFKVLYTGKMSFTMDRLAVSSPLQANSSVEMNGLRYDVETSAASDFIDTVAKIGLDSVSAMTFKASDIHYDFSLRHLHGPTYAELTEKLREVYAATLSGDMKDPSRIFEPLKQYGTILLEHNPEFVIDRIGLAMPEGTAQISGTMSLPGFTRNDLATSPMALLTKLDASVDFAVDEGLLNRNWSSPTPAAMTPTEGGPDASSPVATEEPAAPSRLQAMQSQMAMFEQQGYVVRQGSRLTSHLVFRKGALTVNGKPMGPGAGAR